MNNRWKEGRGGEGGGGGGEMGINLSLVKTANVSGIEENNSKVPISNLLTETNSHNSMTNLKERERDISCTCINVVHVLIIHVVHVLHVLHILTIHVHVLMYYMC